MPSFLDQMRALMALKETFPDMAWDAVTNHYSGSEIQIVIQISDEDAELFRQAVQMFAPR
jgi:hypothetical protein